MENSPVQTIPSVREKHDAGYVFYELILLRENKVYMRKRCPEHGQFEALVYGDARAYTSSTKFNKPGTIPLAFSTPLAHGCPHDCGLCPDHQQHACLGIIEVNSACNDDRHKAELSDLYMFMFEQMAATYSCS